MPSQLKKLALIEEGSPDTVLQFSVVQEGAANASRQVIEIEPADGGELSLENDRSLITSKRYNITVVGLYSSESDRAQLQTWASNQTDLQWSGIGLDGQILQGTGQVVFQEDYEDNVSFRFERATVATGGYSSTTGVHTSGISYSKNGLALYKWGDADGDDLADGWSVENGTFNTTTFSSGQQLLEVDGDGADFQRDIPFPFENIQLSFTLSVDTFNPIDTFRIRLQYYDTTNSFISDDILNVGSSGINTVTGVTPTGSDIAFVRVRVSLDNTTTGTTVSETISNPTVRIGTGTEFIEWNT